MYVDFNGKRYEWAWTKEMMARVITAAIVAVGVLFWVLWPHEREVVSRPVQPVAVQPAPLPNVISPAPPKYQEPALHYPVQSQYCPQGQAVINGKCQDISKGGFVCNAPFHWDAVENMCIR